MLRRASSLLWKLRSLSRTASAGRSDPITFPSSSSSSSRPFPVTTILHFNPVKNYHLDLFLKIILVGGTACVWGVSGKIIEADDGSGPEVVQNDGNGEAFVGLRKVEDGSIVSNTHTVKWRIYTDNGRALFAQGRADEAEKFFISALQEAKEGFGEKDPHVASSCNNLAEVYRIRRSFEKAEPLYLDAIKILEEAFGPEDVRVGAALHNLGQFYLMQQKYDDAQKCFERALKLKGRVLGYGHTDYAETMFYLGIVRNLQGQAKDAEALIKDSIRILEEGGLGESMTCIRRMKHLCQILLKSNKLNDVENLERKILHALEISKGWDSLDTVGAAENLATTLQSLGKIIEARDLTEQCLAAKKAILGEEHVQVSVTSLKLARLEMRLFNPLTMEKLPETAAGLDKAKHLLDDSLRIVRATLNRARKNQSDRQVSSRHKGKEERTAAMTLLQALDTVGLLEATRFHFQKKSPDTYPLEAELALRELITIFNEPVYRSIIDFPDVRLSFVSCLEHLLSIVVHLCESEPLQSSTVQELREQVKHILDELKMPKKQE